MKKLTISEESYWKLMEIKVKMKCRTWGETINELHRLIFEHASFPEQPSKLKPLRSKETKYQSK